MKVVRKMIILSGDGKGVLKLEKIGSRIAGQLNVYRDSSARTAENSEKNGRLYIKNGDAFFRPVSCNGKCEFEIPADGLADVIECVFAENGKIRLSGSNNGRANGARLYAEALSKFPDTAEKGAADGAEKGEKKGVITDENTQKTDENGVETAEETAFSVEKSTENGEISDEKEVMTAENVKKTEGKKTKTTKKSKENVAFTSEENDEKNKNGAPEEIFKNGTVLVNDIVKYNTEYPFYEAVRLQLEELFGEYPAEENLEKAIPESKWAHIDYDNDEFYVVGVINEEKNPRYICYGVPADKNIMPVCDINENCEWLSIDPDTPDLGYYMMYQDAITGETIIKV